MTNQQHPAQFDWATELLDAQGHVTLSAQEANEIGARLRRQHSENETLRVERERNLNSIRVCNEIINKKNAELESLTTGYAAARLEIESLKSQIADHADELTVAHLDGMRGRSTEPAGEYPAPTDAEIIAVMRDGYNCRYNDEADHIDFARAVLAKWGPQPLRYNQPPTLFTVFAKCDEYEGEVPLAQYSATSEYGVLDRVMGDARNAGYTGHAKDRMTELGWRIVPVYAKPQPAPPTPQADSVQDLQPVHDAVTIDLLNERVAYLERKLKEADSVLEDAARYRWLREPRLAAGQGSITVELDDRANGHFSRSIFLAELDAAIDAARAAQEGK